MTASVVRSCSVNGKLWAFKRLSSSIQHHQKQQQKRFHNSSGKEGPESAAQAGEDRDFYLSILNATSTKREARSYLQRFTPPPPLAVGVPLPPPVTAATEFNTSPAPEVSKPTQLFPELAKEEELHVALVKIRDVHSIDDSTLHGVGRTLGQLKRLGLVTVVVVDQPPVDGAASWRRSAESQADRMISSIETNRSKARRVDGALAVTVDGKLDVQLPNLLLKPLLRGVIPVLTSTAYDESQKVVQADAYDIFRSLTHLLGSSSSQATPISLDRLIFLDPLGGIPAPDRPAGAHVFVNIQQEFSTISTSLAASGHTHHLRSLSVIRDALSILPATTSAVITTPLAAASARLPTETKARYKNPLIHNLLTDKPIFSSSLPTHTSPSTQTTLLKHGTPLKIYGTGTRLTDSSKVDLPKLVALIEDSFGKRLDVPHYLARVDANIAGLIIAGDYEGAAIVTWELPPNSPPSTKPVCYLDKFAVARKSQGVGGVADVVFKAMAANVCPAGIFAGAEGIVWRSRRGNVVNRWYFDRARGTYKLKEGGDCWTMFWTGEGVGCGGGGGGAGGGVGGVSEGEQTEAEAGGEGEAGEQRRKASERFKDYVGVCGGVEVSLGDKIR